MEDVSVENIRLLVDSREHDELLDYLVYREPAASIRLLDLAKNMNVENATVLETYYCSYLWALILHQQDAEVNNLVSKILETRLAGGGPVQKSVEAATAYTELDLSTLYQQQTFWTDKQKDYPVVSNLALECITQLQQRMYEFVREKYTAVPQHVLAKLLGITVEDEVKILAKLNFQNEGWTASNGIYVPPPLTKEHEQTKVDSQTDEQKQEKVNRLVGLATLLEQQSYLN